MCAIRALSALLPASVLFHPLSPQLGSGGVPAPAHDGDGQCAEHSENAGQPLRAWTLLLDGFVRSSMAAVRATSDSHEKFVAITALLASLQQYASLLGSSPERLEPAPCADAAPERTSPALGSEGAAGATAVEVPAMQPELARGLFELVLACLDDSLKLVPAAATQVFAALCAIAAKTQDLQQVCLAALLPAAERVRDLWKVRR